MDGYIGRMLKATLLNPWAYISRSSKIGPKEGRLICSKNMLEKALNKCYFPISGQTSDLYQSNLFSNILYASKITKLSFWNF